MMLPMFSCLKQIGVFRHQWQQFRLVHSNKNLRRALLYVPGDDERKIAKIQTLTVDSVILDCEDGVAQNRKQHARETILKVLNEERPSDETDWGVRINGPDSTHLPDDINVLFSRSRTPQTLYLPKVDSTEDIEKFYCIFDSSLKSRNEDFVPPDLFIYSESCVSVMNLPEICQYTKTLSGKCSRPLFRLAGIVFGSDDLVASLGATRTKSSIEILYARQRVVLIAKAFSLQAVDMVDINLNDLDMLRALCDEGARMGYTGKQVIHPMQVEIVQNAFKPTEATHFWARELLKAFEEHQMSGKGAFVFRNQMIDAPTMKQARNIVELMEKIEQKKV